MKPAAVVCLNCGFDLQSGDKLTTTLATPSPDGPQPEADRPAPAATTTPRIHTDTLARVTLDGRSRIDDAALDAELLKANRWKNWQLPLIVLGVSLLLTLVNVLALAPFDPRDIGPLFHGLWAIGRFLFFTPFAVVSLFLIAALFGTSFGRLDMALLKVLTLLLFTGAIDDSVNLLLQIATGGVPFGISMIFVLSVSAGVFWLSAMWLLELEPFEAITMWGILYGLPFLVFALVLVPMLLSLLA
jgi:hypothetical protein